MDRSCSTSCGRQAERGSERCAPCAAVLARRTTWGSRGVGVVAAPPPEARPAEVPSATAAELARAARPAWLASQERLAPLQHPEPLTQERLEAVLTPPIWADRPTPAAPADEPAEPTRAPCSECGAAHAPEEGHASRRVLEPWERLALQELEENAGSSPPSMEEVAAAVEASRSQPATTAPPEETMSTTTEKRLCGRCKTKPLRKDNQSGVCKPCWKALGRPPLGQAAEHLAAEQRGEALRPEPKPGRRRAPAASEAVQPLTALPAPASTPPGLEAFTLEQLWEEVGRRVTRLLALEGIARQALGLAERQ